MPPPVIDLAAHEVPLPYRTVCVPSTLNHSPSAATRVQPEPEPAATASVNSQCFSVPHAGSVPKNSTPQTPAPDTGFVTQLTPLP